MSNLVYILERGSRREAMSAGRNSPASSSATGQVDKYLVNLRRASHLTSKSVFNRLQSQEMPKSPSMPSFQAHGEGADVNDVPPALPSPEHAHAWRQSSGLSTSALSTSSVHSHPAWRAQSPEHTFAFNTDRYWRTYAFDQHRRRLMTDGAKGGGGGLSRGRSTTRRLESPVT